ncbi:MAG: hypothetical protein E7624_07920 [Ruminococcaceae bacterium]|nr:hypothetical protein [Oscillospiraceae bacterium]
MKLALPKNKWLLAFIIAAVVAVAAIVVAIVIGVTSATPDAPPYVEGNEVGVYYYDALDQEVLLTLSGGNLFTISGPQINKTGTYTVDGTTITLDFTKDEDGTATASINGDTVTLVYDNATMSFLKKVNYTVSFNVNGGSEITAVTVINGKTLEKPADPTKEDAIFLGWYADEALTTPYAFNTATVKADTTLYAKWVAKTVGGSEYTVDFDLGYEGGVAPDAITTVGGKVYGLTVPQREGYTFGGWWISMYEDGAKLSFACTADTVLKADTTLFAVWYDNASTKLNAPAVSVGANAISWNAVEGAATYKLTVIDPNGDTVIDNETVGTTTKAFDFAAAAAGEYKITVVAVASNEANNSEPANRYFANKALDRVYNFRVENGILVFGAVENAQKYLITIDCGNENHVHTALDNGASTTYYMANCSMQKGGILITVTAVADGYASTTSEVFVYEKNLAKVEEIVYDAEKDQFVWDAIPGTANYRVTIAVDGKSYGFDNGTATSFSLAGFTGDIVVTVTPVAEGYNSPNPQTASCKKTAPAAPTGLTAAGTVISWNAVEGATSYELSIGTQTVTVTTNQLDLAGSTLILTQGETYAVKVKAVNASGESSSYCATVYMGYFAMNKAPVYAKNTVTWAPVLGVSRYQVRVNGGEIVNVTNANSLKVALTKEGENLIEVRYVSGDTASDWASVTVTAYAVEYDTRSIAFGTFLVEYLAIGDELTLPNAGFSLEGYIFSGWYNAPKGAAGNGKLYLPGTTFTGNAYTVVYAEWTPREYALTLKTEGFNITNIENNAIEYATYTKHFQLTVPHVDDAGMYFFAGWYTGPSGTGIKITDEKGVSVAPYPFTRNVDLYPYYSTNALSFELQEDGTYAVKKGDAIATVTNLVIPVTYNEIPVTKILESGFSGCSTLVTISIPDTITLVGTGALNSCSKLEYIDVYVAKPEEEGRYETFYSSDNGVLLRRDVGDVVYLEVVPKAMTGSYTISGKVDKILTKAFSGTKLTSITVPANVSVLPAYAFYNCSSLETLVFAPGRTTPLEMEKYAIYGCSNLKSITFPANLTADFASLKATLDLFTNLQAINVEEGGSAFASLGGMLTSADKHTILYCPRAYAGALTIPNGVTAIGDNAFYYCDDITSVTIPVWVTSIGYQAFYSCDSITEIVFKGARSADLLIGEASFSYLNGLEKITFEGNGTEELDTGKVTIGERAFTVVQSYAKLHTVEIGAGVNIAEIGVDAFIRQAKLKSFNIADGAHIGIIGEGAFEQCLSLVSFTVPATTQKISEYAFLGCESLALLTFRSEGATSLEIADFAFQNCTALATITLPDHLEEFRSTAFDGCNALKSILVNETNENYVNDANGVLYKKTTDAEDNVVLTELLFFPKGLVKDSNGVVNTLPETLTVIGGSAFADNNFLTSIAIPAGVTKIDTAAFQNCENLVTVTFLGAQNTEAEIALVIGTNAFTNCVALTKDFALPAYTTTIGANAFEGCTFTEFVIPEDVTVIESAAFYKCAALEKVTFNCTGSLALPYEKSSRYGGAFSGCSSLKSIELPAGTTIIGNYTFADCTSLTSVSIGTVTTSVGANGETVYTTNAVVESFGTGAFYFCPNLTTVIIPKSVKIIGNLTFKNDTKAPGKLQNVIFEQFGTEPLEIGTDTFSNNPELTSITFPARTKTLANLSFNASGPAGVSFKYVNGKFVNGSTSTFKMTSTFVTVNGMFANNTALAKINIGNDTVEGVTPYFSSIDGVLYTADQTTLIWCPFANTGVQGADGEPTYEIVIPTSVTTVLGYAFKEQKTLKTVTFAEFEKGSANYGKQLLTLAPVTGKNGETYAVFGGEVTSITTINLPSHLNTINGSVFAVEKTFDVVVTINFNPDSKVELGKYAFRLAKVTALTIPYVSKMDTYAFTDCQQMETLSVTFASTIKKVYDYTFQNCYALTSFVIPDHFTEIGTYAFQNNEALREIIIPNSVTKIGNSAFTGSGLTAVTISHKVTTFGTSVFTNCDSLETVTFALNASGTSSIKKIPNSTFEKCTALTTINLTDLALTDIGSKAFHTCSALPEIDFTKLTTLKTIGTTAFSNTTFEHVDLSKTQLTKVDTSFNNIATLKTFVFPAKTASVVAGAFTNNDALETVTLSPSFTGAMFCPSATTFIFTSAQPDIIIPEDNKNLVLGVDGVIYDPSYQTVYLAKFNADLSNYTIPGSVMKISSYAFAYNQTLDSFTIPQNIAEISAYAFAYSSLKSVTIPASVTTIGNYAFYDTDLATVVFENEHESKLKSLGAFAFGATKLVEVSLPDNLSDMKNSIFIDCTELKKVTLSAGLKELQGFVFGRCYALEEIIFQEGLETMQYLFCSSDGLEESNQVVSVTLPSTLKTMKTNAFNGFRNLKTVTFAEGSQLETIDYKGFYNCESLESINLPATLKTLGYSVFFNCRSLKSIDLAETDITVIQKHTFFNTENLATLTLPKNLEEIQLFAFYNTGVVDLVIPASVTTFGNSAFENAKSLKTLTFSPISLIAELGSTDEGELSNVFKGTTSLETVALPNFLDAIGNHAFENSSVHTVTLADPEGFAELQIVGDYAFANCPNLKGFDYLQNVTAIGECAFLNDVNLELATIYDGLETLGGLAFGFCTKLNVGYIPATVTQLGGNPFAGLSADKITVDANSELFVTEIDANGALTITNLSKTAIYGVFGATGAYTLGEDVTVLGAGAFAGNAITEITVPARVGTIGTGMFMNCKDLTTVTIEDGITEIGAYAFFGSGLTTVEIPATVKTIGDYAFAYCAAIDNVTVPATTTTLGNYAFAYCTALSNFAFEENTTSTYQEMGTHFFYNCPNITEVHLPTKLSLMTEEVKHYGYTSTGYNKDTIPGYTFAGTGIVDAVIPKEIKYYFTPGIFANCVNLEKIIMEEEKSFSKPNSAPFATFGNWLEGCDKFQGMYIDTFIASTTTSDTTLAYTVELAHYSGFGVLHVATITAENTAPLGTYARFEYADENLSVYFDGNTYEEIIEYMQGVARDWTCKIYDKDGNQLFCTGTTGNIAYVLDAQGNVIWGEKPAEDAAQ